MPPLPERRKDRERSGQVPKGRLGAEFGLQRSPRSDDLDPTHTSVWVPANVCGEPPPPERLALGGRDRVSEHRPGRLGLRWPVFSCPSMAGFGVSTEGEDLAPEARRWPLDARDPPSLAEILAGKSSRQKIRVRGESTQRPDVAMESNARKVMAQDRTGGIVDLAKKTGLVPGARQAALDAADPREQPGDA